MRTNLYGAAVRHSTRCDADMPEYRRAFEPGGTFFFTVVTEGRAPILTDPRARPLLRRAFQQTQSRRPFELRAVVLLPDHVHTIWSLPAGDGNFSVRWAFLKKEFTRAWLAGGGQEQTTTPARQRNRRRGVWQRRFWEHTIRDEKDFIRHCDYIHYNQVKHGLVECPHAWPHSSFHRFVNERIYAPNWQCVCAGWVDSSATFEDLAKSAME